MFLTGWVLLMPGTVSAFSSERPTASVSQADVNHDAERVAFERRFQQIREESEALRRNVEALKQEEDRVAVQNLLEEIRNLVGPFATRGQILKGEGQSWEEKRSQWQSSFEKASRKLQMAKSRYGQALSQGE